MIHYVLQVKFATGKIKQVVRVIVAHLGMMHCIQCLLSTGVLKNFWAAAKFYQVAGHEPSLFPFHLSKARRLELP